MAPTLERVVGQFEREEPSPEQESEDGGEGRAHEGDEAEDEEADAHNDGEREADKAFADVSQEHCDPGSLGGDGD